jgi:hypothetical protein
MFGHDGATGAEAQAAAFRAEIQRLRRTRPPDRESADGKASDGPGGTIELGPVSVYEAVTRQMVESLRDELREIKGRLNTLLFMMVGAIMIELAMRIIGP